MHMLYWRVLATAICCYLRVVAVYAQPQTEQILESLDQVLILADKQSYLTTVAEQQSALAKLTKTSAYGNTLNPRIPTTFALTDNTQQAVTFIPAEVFGGPSGTFREITMGQQFITAFTISPQFDLINMGNIARVKSAKINQELTESNNLIAKKNLFDQINATYHNILSLKGQLDVLQQSKTRADSIHALVQNKHNNGIARQQELNEASVNVILIQDKIQQADLSIQQQTLALQILCDTHLPLTLTETLQKYTNPSPNAPISEGNLLVTNKNIQHQLSLQEYRASLLQNLPTLSFVSSLNWQNNSNRHFFDSQSRWINSNYWGLRLTWDFPTNVTKLTNVQSNEINLRILRTNIQHLALQNDLQNRQMELDYDNALAQYNNAITITQLKYDTYQKTQNLYLENILPLDKLLTAQTDYINSQLTQVTALANIAFTLAKIRINNTIK